MDGAGELERRLIGEAPGLHVNEQENGRTVIRGYAALYNSDSQLLGGDNGFIERIAPGAFDEVMRSNPDVFGRYNHDRLLARTSSGTMKLEVDERGLRYTIYPKRADADLVESIARGDVRGSSFAFRTSGANERWFKDERGRVIREIRKFDSLHDAGPVDNPAYPATEAFVSQRAMRLAQATPVPEEPAHEQREESAPVEPAADTPAAPLAEAQAPVEERAAVSLKPTAGMAQAARRGLKLHEEGKSGDGLKPETVARANRLAKREEMNEDWVREMNAWFARHETASKSPGWNTPGEEKPGYVAWLLWGGDPAKNWAARKVKELDGERDLPEIDEERDVEPEPTITVVVSADVTDFQAKIASLKATMLRTHLHGK